MAEIHVFYHLSDNGKVAALAAGRNAGDRQHIVLRSPGHVAPEAPIDVLSRVLKFAERLPDAPATNASLVDVAKGLTAAVAVLAQALDPSTAQNVTVEDASPETWALATGLAVTNKDGFSAVAIGYDTNYFAATVGYSVYHETRRNVFEVKPDQEMRPSDRLLTAAEALPLEFARRAALAPLLAEAQAEAERQAAAYNAEKAEESLQSYSNQATSFLERNMEYADLPEVVSLQALVDAGDRAALVGSYETRPQEIAEKAVTKAKTAKTLMERRMWVDQYGSERTKRLAAEGLNFESEYQEERLQLEMSGWKYGGEYPSSNSRKPTLGELRLLDFARQATSEEVTLRWVGTYDKGGYRPGRRFMDRHVYLNKPVEPGTENDPAALTA